MRRARIAALLAVCLLAGLAPGDAQPMKCKAKGAVKYKSGKTTFQSSLCWDGVIAPTTIILLTWKMTNMEYYVSGILGNSSDLMAGVKFGTLASPIKTIKTFEGSDTADSLIDDPGEFANKRTLLKLICSGNAEIGILTKAPGDAAPKIAMRQAVKVDPKTVDDCAVLNSYPRRRRHRR